MEDTTITKHNNMEKQNIQVEFETRLEFTITTDAHISLLDFMFKDKTPEVEGQNGDLEFSAKDQLVYLTLDLALPKNQFERDVDTVSDMAELVEEHYGPFIKDMLEDKFREMLLVNEIDNITITNFTIEDWY